MAVVKAPLLSLDASGSVAEAITFSKWKGRNYVRQLVKPSNPNSGLQVGVRAGLRFVTQIYASLSATIKGRWKTLGDPQSITSLDAMVQLNQIRVRQDFGVKQDPTLAEGVAEAAPAGPAATAQPLSLKVTWTDSVGADDWATAIYMLAAGVVTPSPATLIRIIKRGVQTFTVVGLITGTVYHFALRGIEKGGTLGTATADFTGTPT